MTLTTWFVNKTTLEFKLKEGNAGVYRELGTLAALPSPTAEPSEDNKMKLEFDESATYKVYRAVTSESGIRISISWEEILRNAKLYIVPDAHNEQNYRIEGDSRSARRHWWGRIKK